MEKLPRNLNHDELAMTTEISEIEVWSKDEWRAALARSLPAAELIMTLRQEMEQALTDRLRG
jgi:hypothetical protein